MLSHSLLPCNRLNLVLAGGVAGGAEFLKSVRPALQPKLPSYVRFSRLPRAGEMICVANYSVSTIFTISDALAQAPLGSILTPADGTT